MDAIGPSVILEIAVSVIPWFLFLRKEQVVRSEEERRAIKALMNAANETVLYFRRLDRPDLATSEEERREFQRNIQAEEKLSQLWMNASAELRGINKDLSNRCYLKGRYWSNRDSWSNKDVRKANIKLEKMTKEAEALLRG